MKNESESELTQLCQLFVTLWMVASSIDGILQARITGVGCHFLL